MHVSLVDLVSHDSFFTESHAHDLFSCFTPLFVGWFGFFPTTMTFVRRLCFGSLGVVLSFSPSILHRCATLFLLYVHSQKKRRVVTILVFSFAVHFATTQENTLF